MQKLLHRGGRTQNRQLVKIHCRLSGHLNAESASCPFVHIVGDGDGGGHLAKVGHQAAVEAAHPLRSDNVPEEAPGVSLLLGQLQLGPRLGLQLCPEINSKKLNAL